MDINKETATTGSARYIKRSLSDALRAKYVSQQREAVATLDVYFNNPVGIGEHPQILEEMSKQIEKLANAEDNLKALEAYNRGAYFHE